MNLELLSHDWDPAGCSRALPWALLSKKLSQACCLPFFQWDGEGTRDLRGLCKSWSGSHYLSSSTSGRKRNKKCLKGPQHPRRESTWVTEVEATVIASITGRYGSHCTLRQSQGVVPFDKAWANQAKRIYKSLTGASGIKRILTRKIPHIPNTCHDRFSFLSVLHTAHSPAPFSWNFPETFVMITNSTGIPSLPSHTAGRGGFPPLLMLDRALWLASVSRILADAKGAEAFSLFVGFGLTPFAQLIYIDGTSGYFLLGPGSSINLGIKPREPTVRSRTTWLSPAPISLPADDSRPMCRNICW